MLELCAKLNDASTFACVTAERAFLRAMGGGCLSPVAAHATRRNDSLSIRAVALKEHGLARAEAIGSVTEAETLGTTLAAKLR
jgi:hydroxymethylbilane synthase